MKQVRRRIKIIIRIYQTEGLTGVANILAKYFFGQKTIIKMRSIIKRKRKYRPKETPLKLYLGCGGIHLEGYVNIDVEDWSGACDLVANATNLSMFEDNSVDHIFTHALLGHIPPWDTIKTLKEWNRILKPGATIQIETPDLERVFYDWLINKTLSEEGAISCIYGGNKSPDKAYTHQDYLTGFTYNRLARMMKECGFTNFKRLEHPKYHHNLVVYAQKESE